MKNFLLALTVLVGLQFNNQHLLAHCEIPCGIYEDTLRIQMISEHISTIEKSMNKINEISKSAQPNYNQLVRWVDNKETHAKAIQEIVSQYFLHQRIKIKEDKDEKAYTDYQAKLVYLHKLLVYSMKSKQTTDLKYIEMMYTVLKDFSNSYFHKH